MTRAVIFDVDGVLVHGYHAKPELQQRWDEDLLADLGVDPQRFRDEFIFDVFIKKVVIGQTALIPALDRVLPSLGYHGSSMVFAHYWLSRDSKINSPLIDLVRQLRANADIRLFLATNQDHMRAQWLWQTLGLSELFEDIFYSARIGARKPDPAFFKFVDAKLGPQSEPPLFFDDSPANITAARAAGWDAVQFDTTDDFTSYSWVADRL